MTYIKGVINSRGSGFVPGGGLRADDCRRVACPRCEVIAGRRCVKLRGSAREYLSGTHKERKEAFRASGIGVSLYARKTELDRQRRDA
jgi:hypothetical protein